MSQPIISVENLSKAYRIGAKEEVSDTLMGALTNSVRSPFRNLRRLRDATSIRSGDEGDDVLWALRDVSFQVNEGEVVGVIGRNGAGKSTLLKILSRITEPTGGRAVIRGRVSSLLEVGTGFHPELTGRENIYMNGTILGMTKREIDRKFDEIVDFSGVEKFLDTPTKRYSSGMQVRLAFAVAAHLEPEILIIDEVLAVGDAEFQKKCLGKMQDVAKGGRTVLFVSHNMAAIQSMCGRGLHIQNGTLGFDGITTDAISNYLDKKSQRTSYSDGTVDLGSHPNRKRGSSPLLSRLTLFDAKGNPSFDSHCNSPLTFQVEIDSSREESGLRCALFVCRDGQRLMMFHSSLHSDLVLPRQRRIVVNCTTEPIPILPAIYDVDIAIGNECEVIDYIESVCQIQVLPGIANSNGKLPTLAQAQIATSSKWTLSCRHKPLQETRR